MAAPLAHHPGWVAAASVSLEALDSTLSHVTRELLIAGAALVAAAGLGAYGLARAALSPDERLRREVAALSERDMTPGVGVPRTRDEIAALATTMNQLLSRLQHALARQRALVADASHELRTPFAVLRGELELASRPGSSRQELAAAVEQASEETARLARITEQLPFLARTDEDRIPPRREPTNIRVLLTRSAEHAASRASSADVSCQVDAPAELAADINPHRIGEAIDNLACDLTSAAWACRAGSLAVLRSVSVQPDERLARVRVLRERGQTPKQIARALGIRPAEAGRLVRTAAILARAEAPEPAVAGCWISPAWSTGLIIGDHSGWPLHEDAVAGSDGLVAVLVAREHRHGKVSVCGYLADVYCLGVKNALGPEIMDDLRLRGFVRDFFSGYYGDPLEAPIELAREVVLGSVEYARSLGFDPHPDFAAAEGHLGSWAGPGAITFGKEGKPLYISGPYDDPDPVIRTLERTVGRGNFEFLAVAG